VGKPARRGTRPRRRISAQLGDAEKNIGKEREGNNCSRLGKRINVNSKLLKEYQGKEKITNLGRES